MGTSSSTSSFASSPISSSTSSSSSFNPSSSTSSFTSFSTSSSVSPPPFFFPQHEVTSFVLTKLPPKIICLFGGFCENKSLNIKHADVTNDAIVFPDIPIQPLELTNEILEILYLDEEYDDVSEAEYANNEGLEMMEDISELPLTNEDTNEAVFDRNITTEEVKNENEVETKKVSISSENVEDNQIIATKEELKSKEDIDEFLDVLGEENESLEGEILDAENVTIVDISNSVNIRINSIDYE